MGISFKTIEVNCKKCGRQLIRFQFKSPFTDDFADECTECSPGDAICLLRSWDRAAAREEEASDRHCESEEEEQNG